MNPDQVSRLSKPQIATVTIGAWPVAPPPAIRVMNESANEVVKNTLARKYVMLGAYHR